MLPLFDLIHLVAIAASTSLYSNSDYLFPQERETAVTVELHREWWRSDSDCTWSGLMVPFVQDWDTVIKDSEGADQFKIAPNPEKTAGMAFLINKKSCPGKKPEAVWMADTITTSTLRGGLLRKHRLNAEDISAAKDEDKPKWYRQVLGRVERIADTDPQAKEFLAFTAQAVQRQSSAIQDASAPASEVGASEKSPAPELK